MSIPHPVTYEYADEYNIPKELFCSICLKPWVVPFETKCEHVFCYSCIYAVAADPKGTCPMCRTPIDVKSLGRVTRVLREQVDALEVFCQHRSRGCMWSGARGDHGAHTGACPMKPPPRGPHSVGLDVVCEYDAYLSHDALSILGVIHIQGPKMSSDDEKTRKPITVACCLDRSGSMAGHKLTLLKDTMRFVVGEMIPDDQLAIICYDDAVYETLPLTRMDAKGKGIALDAIDGIVRGGQTNISGGLFAGMDAHRGMFVPEDYGGTRVVALSPYQFNLYVSNDYKRQGRHHYTIRIKSDVAGVMAHADVVYDGVDEKPQRPLRMVAGECAGEFVCLLADSPRLTHVTIRVTFVSSAQDAEPMEIMQPLFENSDDSLQVLPVSLKVPMGAKAVTAPTPSRSICTNPVCSTWLFTDGQANEGITHPEELTHAVKTRMKTCAIDTTVFTFGFGSDHNRDLLSTVSSGAHGMYYFIDGAETIKSSFADCLGGLVSTVCQELQLRMELSPGVTLKRLVTKYSHKVEDGVITIAMKDLYSEEQRDIVFEVDCPPCGTPTDKFVVAECRLECVNLLTAEKEVVTSRCVVSRPSTVVGARVVNDRVDEQRNRLAVTEALEVADGLAKKGDYKAAKKTLSDAREGVKKSKSHATPFAMCLQEQLEETTECVEDEGSYATHGQYDMTRMTKEHQMQRCAKGKVATSASGGMYSNESKTLYRSKGAIPTPVPAPTAPLPPPPPPPPQSQGKSFMSSFFSSSKKTEKK